MEEGRETSVEVEKANLRGRPWRTHRKHFPEKTRAARQAGKMPPSGSLMKMTRSVVLEKGLVATFAESGR